MILRHPKPTSRDEWPVTLNEQLRFYGQVLDKVTEQAQARLNETVPRWGTQPV